MNEFLKDIQLITAGALTSMIWLIQILHYPSFNFYDDDQFQSAMAFHQRRITFIVVPLMFTELGLSLYQWFLEKNVLNTFSLACVLLIWASTFFIQVPVHSKLVLKDERLIQSLVRGNMIRTGLWSLKLVLLLVLNY